MSVWGETRAAVLEDGLLVELYVERENSERIVGNIYKGRVENVLPGMQAAFVDIGLERNAFLYVDDALAYRNAERTWMSLWRSRVFATSPICSSPVSTSWSK